MELTYTTIDRSKWPSPEGRWSGEPDKVQWEDSETGFTCLAVRHPNFGHWCGYVGLPVGNPNFEKHYNEVDADCHGGRSILKFYDHAEHVETGI